MSIDSTAQEALTPEREDAAASWWRQAAVYQIYPRSFADLNGEGIGDLKGITSRVGYLESLGIDAVWLSPFYPSALADGGYDVDDYRDVDPRIGCRVPLPWSSDTPSYGFGPDGAHLPQPAWFADCAVSEQENDPESTLNLYRDALALRHRLPTAESLEWVDSGSPDVLHFRRRNDWEVVTNFGESPVRMPAGEVVLSSRAIHDDELSGETTVWQRH